MCGGKRVFRSYYQFVAVCRISSELYKNESVFFAILFEKCKEGMYMADKLTEGPVLTKITRFAVPILFGQILQQLYNIVDSIIVGRFVGVGGLAAVGATWSLTYIVCFSVSAPVMA